MRRSVEKLLDDMLQAAGVAEEIIGFRIVVDHAYHRLDYGRVWNTLHDDIPRLRAAIERYRG
ncbi:MAG: DUF86 domain-containing protein [Actinomycetota bacterium]|nr:DUF86 domain-containing protein [Actinomycetota bacterium]